MTKIRISNLDGEELRDALQIASNKDIDLQVEPQPEIVEPVTAILIGGGVLLAAKFIVDLIEKLKGGVLIDLRPGALSLVRRDRAIPFGWATVIAVDGSVKIEIHDAPKDSTERLLGEIISGSLKTAKEVASAAAKAVGLAKVREGS